MIRQKKEESVKRIEEMLSSSSVVIATDYRGMSVSEMSKLRRQLRVSGVEYHVVKNTMASIAADNAGREELKDLLKGPTAMAFGHGEVNEPARLLLEYIRTSRASLTIKGGLLSTRALTPEQVSMLSTLPPRAVMVAHLLRQMQSPIGSLVAVLRAELTALPRVLQARKQQLEGG